MITKHIIRFCRKCLKVLTQTHEILTCLAKIFEAFQISLNCKHNQEILKGVTLNQISLVSERRCKDKGLS